MTGLRIATFPAEYAAGENLVKTRELRVKASEPVERDSADGDLCEQIARIFGAPPTSER